MILSIYIIILFYFLLGGIGFYFINRTKDRQTAKANQVKYITYFLIINILFFSIIINSKVFYYLSILIIFIGTGEMLKVFRQASYKNGLFFGLSFLIYLVISTGFLHFSRLDSGIILFTFLILSIFDAFSQISGQLMGIRKLLPVISPGKTLEGLIGGAIIAIASSVLIKNLVEYGILMVLMLASGIVVFAFLGDIAGSVYKRKYKVKDFSTLLPGQGGFLDRFDSLIAGGAFIALLEIIGLLNN